MILLGVDTGGTFTDFVLSTDDGLRIHKCLSTPEAPERAILQGIDDLGLKPGTFTLVHGSTVATNAVLEGKGVKTVYLTNAGFTDLLTIGRQARRELYNLTPELEIPPVPPELCLGLPSRRDAKGRELQALSEKALDDLAQRLNELQPTAVAVNLLFSYLVPEDEQRIKARFGSDYFLSCSSEVLPAPREYERGVATWLNAYVGPLMRGYLHRLQAEAGDSPLAVMQSSGGTIAAELAAERAVNLLLSGPAGGMMAAKVVAERLGIEKVLTFDMGGTSTDVSLIDGSLRLSTECRVAGYPVAVPMVDIHTIGAGGGSVAGIDAGGALIVGPESAGAMPGPACYGHGGERPTVTDANVVLGRLPSAAALGGSMCLDAEAAERAFVPLAKQMGGSIVEAAEGVRCLANEHMAQALRVISVQRGEDPREYALMAFGGAAGLHVCALADALKMSRAVVPANAGVLSAMGMVVAPASRDMTLSVESALADIDANKLNEKLAMLREDADLALEREGQLRSSLICQLSADCRYQGQSHSLNITLKGERLLSGWGDVAQAEFKRLHEKRYGHILGLPVEVVALRLRVEGQRVRSAASIVANDIVKQRGGEEALPLLDVAGVNGCVKAYWRTELVVGARVLGPAVILEPVATTFIDLGWVAELQLSGDIVLLRQGDGA